MMSQHCMWWLHHLEEQEICTELANLILGMGRWEREREKERVREREKEKEKERGRYFYSFEAIHIWKFGSS